MPKGQKIINFLSSFLAFGKLPKESHLMGIAFFLDNIGALITTLFTLILVEKKGLSISEAGMFLSACTVVSLPVILFSGWISDRIGEKKSFFPLVFCRFL